jgi:multimeric flavodoxin WrbA
LTSGTFTSASQQDNNPLSISNTATYIHNFGMLEFGGSLNDRFVSFVMYDKMGNELWRIKRLAEDLGVKKK